MIKTRQSLCLDRSIMRTSSLRRMHRHDRYMQMNARLLLRIRLSTDNWEYFPNCFDWTICKLTLSQCLLSNHNCLQYQSSLNILNVLFINNSLSRANLTTPWQNCRSIMLGWNYSNLVFLYNPLSWIIFDKLTLIR